MQVTLDASSVLLQVEARLSNSLSVSQRREVIEAVADAIVGHGGDSQAIKLAATSDVGPLRYAAARFAVERQDTERLVSEALDGNEDAISCCRFLLSEPRSREWTADAIGRCALATDSSIRVISRLLRSEGGSVLASAGYKLAESCVHDDGALFEVAALWLLPALCALGSSDAIRDTRMLRDAYLEAATSSIDCRRRELALGALVACRSVLLAEAERNAWDLRVSLAISSTLLSSSFREEEKNRTSRRYAIRLLEHSRGAQPQWRDWLSAYATAEFESSVHLFDHALDTLQRFSLDTPGGEGLEWTAALASRMLINVNPSVRKAVVSKVLSLTRVQFPWHFVKDVLLSTLGDAEIRKGKDFARDMDVSAYTFFVSYIANAPDQVFDEICRFACSKSMICAANDGRGALLAAMCSIQQSSSGNGRTVRLTTEDILGASDALSSLGRTANNATTRYIVEAVAAVVCGIHAADVELNAAAMFARVAWYVSFFPRWLGNLTNANAWARYCSLESSDDDAASAVVAVLALDTSRFDDWMDVARALILAKSPETFVLCCATRAVDETTRAMLWSALNLEDVEQLDRFTKDSLLNRRSSTSTNEAFLSAADLRERIGRLAAHNSDSATCLAWRQRSLDVVNTARTQLSDTITVSPECSLRLLRCIRACFVAAAPLIESADELARLAAKVSQNAVCDNKLQSAIESEQWALTALVAETSRDVHFELEVTEIAAALQRCNAEVFAVVAVLRCALVAIRQYSRRLDGDCELAALVSGALIAAKDSNRIASPKIIHALTSFVFAPACAVALKSPLPRLTSMLVDCATQLLQLAQSRRPHISRALVNSFASACREVRDETIHGDSIAFAQILVPLVLDREPELRASEIPDGVDDTEVSQDSLVRVSRARLSALRLLEDENGGCPSELRRAICLELLRMDVDIRENQYNATARKGSAPWGERLRVWQALCVIAPRLSTSDEEVRDVIMLNLTSVLISPCLPCVRYAVETACVSFASRWPFHALPLIFDRLARVRDAVDGTEGGIGGRELALASLLAVAGHVIVEYDEDDRNSDAILEKVAVDKEAQIKFAPDLLQVALALQGSTRGLVRGMSQLLILALCPHQLDPGEMISEDATYINSTIASLKRDPDVVRHAQRQRRFFWQLRSQSRCTVRGMLESGVMDGGDVTAESIVTYFKTQILEVAREIEQYDQDNGYGQLLWRPPTNEQKVTAIDGNSDATPETVADKKQRFVQRKIDQLIAEEYSESTWPRDDDLAANQVGRDAMTRVSHGSDERMRVIVCASLVDKAANLAGLARTAEVFAAEAVIVPDIRVAQTLAFKAVSVTAERWIPLEECPPKRLLSWLYQKRREGYAIVALEQATGSVSLTNAVLPTPAILLLGHEKEGLDVDLLHAVDMCIEVPQLGKVRSLNVHVSGALALWQWTRQFLISQQQRTA